MQLRENGDRAEGHSRAPRVRSALVALVVAVLLSATLASPASAVTVPPTVAQPTAIGGAGSAKVSWSSTEGSAGPILSYEIRAYDVSSGGWWTQVVSAGSAGPSTGADYTLVLLNNHRYEFTVTAIDAAGRGPESPQSASVLVNAAWPFFNSVACVRKQFADLLGIGSPSADQVKAWSDQIDHLDVSCSTVAQQFWLSAGFQSVVPSVARLYQAYFLRIPDFGGIDYWVAKRRAGTILSSISKVFAASDEFTSTYGSLTNAQFVALVYQNVLGRESDPTGAAYWVGKLDEGRIGRGSLMLLFSDSQEFSVGQDPRIKAELLVIELLRRTPTETEVTQLAGQLPNAADPTEEEDDLLTQIELVMESPEYLLRAIGVNP